MSNTYYSAFTVAKNYCDANNLTISNYGLFLYPNITGREILEK